MGGRSSGCPVQHTKEKSPSSAVAADGQSSSAALSSTPDRGRGVWPVVASWLPFRGERGDASDSDSATDYSASSAQCDSASAAKVARGTTVGTKEHGGVGCSVKSSEEGDDQAPPSGCPVQHDSARPSPAAAASQGLGKIWGFLSGVEDGSDSSEKIPATAAAAAEPGYNALNNEYVYGQEVAAGQEVPLSTARQRSTIPKADFNPDHQPQTEAEKWVYPSEQQYYNAIKRKGYKASAADMPSTLAIHNAVNEKGWQMVLEWETARAGTEAAAAGGQGAGGGGGGASDPKLLRFTGRPKDTSPKAWIKSTLLGYRPPFDRHDWTVKRADGSEARYVIDFYAGKPPPGSNMPVAMHLDVRPALDSVDSAIARTQMFYRRELRPYLSRVVDAFKSDPGPPPSEQDAPPPSSAR